MMGTMDRRTQNHNLELDKTKILGVLWDQSTDQIAIMFLHLNFELAKREIMPKIASCYNTVGLVAPILLVGKSIHRSYCALGVSLDQPLPEA